MTFKEAMSEMIDGKICKESGLHYRFQNTTLEFKCAGNWQKSYNSMTTLLGSNWQVVKKSIIIDGKTIELSEESYQELKRSLT